MWMVHTGDMTTRNAPQVHPVTPSRVADAVTILAIRYTGPSYGYDVPTALDYANTVAGRADAERLAVILGEHEGCNNCGRVAVASHMCRTCLPLLDD